MPHVTAGNSLGIQLTLPPCHFYSTNVSQCARHTTGRVAVIVRKPDFTSCFNSSLLLSEDRANCINRGTAAIKVGQFSYSIQKLTHHEKRTSSQTHIHVCLECSWYAQMQQNVGDLYSKLTLLRSQTIHHAMMVLLPVLHQSNVKQSVLETVNPIRLKE